MTAGKNLIQAAAGNAGGEFYGYTIDNSARFEDGDSPYLYRSTSTPDDATRGAISFWVKRGNLSTAVNPISCAGTSVTACYFQADNTLNIYDYMNGGGLMQYVTTRVFRDTSAWYHILLIINTNEATALDRVKLYVNGVRETSFSTSTTGNQSASSAWLIAQNCNIGRYASALNLYYDGYMSEVARIDGTVYSPTDFGEDKNGVWVPKDLSALSFGSEGFYMKFGNSGSLGTDSSGNSNNFTSSGLTSSDQMIDTPTNNFATLNPVIGGASGNTLSEGNLKVATVVSGSLVPSSMAVGSSGKYYAEFRWISGTHPWIGAGTLNGGSGAGVYSADGSISWAAYGSSNLYENTSVVSSGYGTISSGDIVGVVIDVDSNQVSFYKNGTLAVTRTFSSGTIDNTWGFTPTDGSGSSSDTWVCNFGQNGTFNGAITAGGNSDANGIGDFKYTVPTGALALCTANLPEPAIGPNSTTTSGENFETIIYTGDSVSPRTFTTSFAPDLVWIKDRSGWAFHHRVYDRVRGFSNRIWPSSNVIENYSPSYGSPTGTTSTSLTFADTDNPNGYYGNATGGTYVMWNWKADGTSGSSNTDGTITSTVSANTDSGFSIVTYTGSSSGISVGHGLSSAPEMIIWKARGTPNGTTRSWIVWTKDLTSTDYIVYLNLTNAQTNVTAGSVLSSSPTATTFSLGTEPSVNWNAEDYVAYCFHSVEGFSSIGSYTGNGSSDGPFIYTGFRPAWVLIKNTSAAFNWILHDTARDPDNIAEKVLYPDIPNAEDTDPTYTSLDILSNGFKLRASHQYVNYSGYNYIYMAFAENPFKYSNAR